MGVIPTHTRQEHTKALGQFLPTGPVFQSAFNPEAILYKFLDGLSPEFKSAEDAISRYQDQFFPDTTEDYILQWERHLGIPDNVFTGQGTDAERRRDIVTKILARRVRTWSDIEALVTRYGVTASIRKSDQTIAPTSSTSKWPLKWPFRWGSGGDIGVNRNIVFITIPRSTGDSTWPVRWPLRWGRDQSFIERLILNLMSAELQVVFE